MTESLIIFFIGLIIFFACREIMCWYWKVNEGVELLTKIENHLSELNPNAINSNPKKIILNKPKAELGSKSKPKKDSEPNCPGCGKLLDWKDINHQKCYACGIEVE